MAQTAGSFRRKARILIVDDHPMMREGIALRISKQDDMEVSGEASSVTEALTCIAAHRPDLMIVDIALADSYGLELVQEVTRRYPTVRSLVVSGYEESLYGERCLRAGARGYVNKRDCHEKILPAIRAVLQGQHYLSETLTQTLLQQAVGGARAANGDPVDRLSNRELQVFRLIGEGWSTTAIAERLHLSVHTIDSHRDNIKRKLGAKSGAELQRQALQWVMEDR